MRLVNRISFAAALTLATVFGMPAAGAHQIKFGDLVIGHPWVRPSAMAAGVAAGFMTITNNGKVDDRLVKVTAEITSTVQIDDVKMVGSVMKTQALADGLVIPAGARVVLKSNALQIMFLNVKEPLMEGEEFSGTLTFEKAGTVPVDFEVMAPDSGMDAGMDAGMD